MADARAPDTSTGGPPPELKPDADWLLDGQAPPPAEAESAPTQTDEWLVVSGSGDDVATPDPRRPPAVAPPSEAHAEPPPETPRGRLGAWRQRRRARREDPRPEAAKPAVAAPEPGPTVVASGADDWAAAAGAQGDTGPVTADEEEASPVADEWTATEDAGEAPAAEADSQAAESESAAHDEPAAESEPAVESKAAEGELRHSIDELHGRVAAALEGLERVESAVQQTRRGRAADVQRLERLEAKLEQSSGGDRERFEELRAEVEGIRRERAADKELLAVVTQRFRTMLPPPANPGDGPLDLNAATFEQLRGLGISTSQAGRVIAAREATGGYGSLDELDGLFGFSAEQLADFKRQVRV